MIPSFLRRRFRLLKKRLRNKQFLLLVVVLAVAGSTLIYSMFMSNERQAINPSSYSPLLHVIGQAESRGNYNAYFGNAGNTSIKFTDMTIAEVMQWQAVHVQQGNLSSAVGKYQIIDTTLAGLVSRLSIDTSQKFSAAMQDQLAIALIERRGSVDYVNQQLTREQLAHNLAKEWAGLPKVIGDKPAESYYAGDGLNQSRAGVDEVMQAVEAIEPQR